MQAFAYIIRCFSARTSPHRKICFRVVGGQDGLFPGNARMHCRQSVCRIVRCFRRFPAVCQFRRSQGICGMRGSCFRKVLRRHRRKSRRSGFRLLRIPCFRRASECGRRPHSSGKRRRVHIRRRVSFPRMHIPCRRFVCPRRTGGSGLRIFRMHVSQTSHRSGKRNRRRFVCVPRLRFARGYPYFICFCAYRHRPV